MASLLVLRRAINSSLLVNRLTNPVRLISAAPSATVSRFFNTNAPTKRYYDDDVTDDELDRRSLSRRRVYFPAFFSDAFDPFSQPRSVSQLNLMNHMMKNPFVGTGVGTRRGWDVKEDGDALYLRMDMPGLDKKNVKVSVEKGTLIIKGEGEKESEGEEYGRSYSSRVDLTPNMYKIDGIKAEMKNGVLKVVVPRVKEEERKDVRQVKIE